MDEDNTQPNPAGGPAPVVPGADSASEPTTPTPTPTPGAPVEPTTPTPTPGAPVDPTPAPTPGAPVDPTPAPDAPGGVPTGGEDNSGTGKVGGGTV